MRALSGEPRTAATETVRPVGTEDDQTVGDVLADIAATLWPVSTAANLATEIGCTVRTAERYLGGQRDWSGDAVAVIVAEVLKRHSMRNVKVNGR